MTQGASITLALKRQLCPSSRCCHSVVTSKHCRENAMLRRTRAVIVVAGALTLLAAHRADAADFYAGKTITISTYGAPGDSYDAYMRLLARHYGRHIPGNPRFIAINQTGPGRPVAINHPP